MLGTEYGKEWLSEEGDAEKIPVGKKGRFGKYPSLVVFWSELRIGMRG